MGPLVMEPLVPNPLSKMVQPITPKRAVAVVERESTELLRGVLRAQDFPAQLCDLVAQARELPVQEPVVEAVAQERTTPVVTVDRGWVVLLVPLVREVPLAVALVVLWLLGG